MPRRSRPSRHGHCSARSSRPIPSRWRPWAACLGRRPARSSTWCSVLQAIAGQSVLAVATLAVQGHADLELPQGSTAPLSSFFFTVAQSGERKSTADRKALWPIREREKILRAQHDDALPAYTIRQASWEASRKQILSNRKLSRDAKHAELEQLGPPPRAPLTPLLTCPEPTFEGLCLLLQSGHPSVGVFSAEGAQFLGGYGMSKDHRLKTAAALSAIWDGEPIKRVRRGDGIIQLPGRRVTMHLLAQPGVSNLLLGSRELHDQGLVSRVLASAPMTTAGSRFWKDTRPESERAIGRYGARILGMLERTLPLERDKPNELAPRTLKLAQPGPATPSRLHGPCRTTARAKRSAGRNPPLRAQGARARGPARMRSGSDRSNSMSRRSLAITSRPASCSRSTTPPRHAACMTPGKATPTSILRNGCSTGSPGIGLATR